MPYALADPPEVHVASRDYDGHYPAAFLARRLGISSQLFNYWRSTGKITAVATDRRTGKPLYRYRDALQVDAQTRSSKHSSRHHPTGDQVNASEVAA